MKKRWLKKKWLIDIGLILVVLTALGYWQSRHLHSAESSLAEPLSQLSASAALDLQGEPLAWDDERISLFYFFAPWCQVCRWTINNLNFLLQPAWSKKVRVVGVALDYGDDQTVRRFIDDNQVDIPVYLAGAEVAQLFRVQSFPTYYILDHQQVVQNTLVGYTSSWGLWWRLWRIHLFNI